MSGLWLRTVICQKDRSQSPRHTQPHSAYTATLRPVPFRLRRTPYSEVCAVFDSVRCVVVLSHPLSYIVPLVCVRSLGKDCVRTVIRLKSAENRLYSVYEATDPSKRALCRSRGDQGWAQTPVSAKMGVTSSKEPQPASQGPREAYFIFF